MCPASAFECSAVSSAVHGPRPDGPGARRPGPSRLYRRHKHNNGGLAFASSLCHASEWRRGRTGIVRNRWPSCQLPCRNPRRTSLGAGSTKLEKHGPTDSPPRHVENTPRPQCAKPMCYEAIRIT